MGERLVSNNGDGTASDGDAGSQNRHDRWRRFERSIGDYAEAHAWARRVLEYGPFVSAVLAGLTFFIPSGVFPQISAWIIRIIPAILGFLAAVHQRDLSSRAGEKAAESEAQYQAGVQEGLDRWQASSGVEAAAQQRLYRHLHYLLRHAVRRDAESGEPPPADVTGEEVIRMLLLILRNKFSAQMEDITINSINLMLKHKQRKKHYLRVVCFDLESVGRHAGRKVQIKQRGNNEGAALGAASVYYTKLPQYVPDAAILNLDGDRPYKSILSFPVLCGCGQEVLGVVNIDSSVVDGFSGMGDTVTRNAVFHACSDILQLISLALLDRTCFRTFANRGYTRGA